MRKREPETASLHQMEAVSQSDLVKPALVAKERVRATTGLPGVKGDGAQGKRNQELGRPRPAGGDVGRKRETITGYGPGEESEGLMVAMKRVTTAERRSPAEDGQTQEKEKAAWLRTNTVRRR